MSNNLPENTCDTNSDENSPCRCSKNLFKNLESRNTLILGLGKEGLSSYKFFRENFPNKQLFLVDKKPLSELGSEWQNINENDHKVEFSTDIKTVVEKLNNSEHSDKTIVIKSPGIFPTNPLIIEAKKIKGKITSSTNIFFKLLKTLEKPDILTIGVTGTKGKSTATSMINHVLKDCGIKTFLGGNIGIPPLSLWNEIKEAALKQNISTKTSNSSATNDLNKTNKPIVIVLEMSCHQLNDLIFSPNIAVILDVSPEHLDYYENFESYVKAKSQISRFQTSDDLIIFNNKQKIPTDLANLGKAKQITFNFESNVSDNSIVYQDETIININDLSVLGKHNILNSIPSVIIAKKLGCPTSDINRSLKTFKTLPHRLEIVSNAGEIIYVNDSLSTTPKSTIAAIESFNKSPIILIAGGHDRNLNFDELGQTIASHNIKHLILLPDTGEKILKSVKKYEQSNLLKNKKDTLTISDSNIEYTHVNNMEEAVKTAKSITQKGDIVLLSPASASFNIFKDYKDRGNQFKKQIGL